MNRKSKSQPSQRSTQKVLTSHWNLDTCHPQLLTDMASSDENLSNIPRRTRLSKGKVSRKNYQIEEEEEEEDRGEVMAGGSQKRGIQGRCKPTRSDSDDEEEPAPSAYELERRANIVRNKAVLATIGLEQSAQEMKEKVASKERQVQHRKSDDEDVEWNADEQESRCVHADEPVCPRGSRPEWSQKITLARAHTHTHTRRAAGPSRLKGTRKRSSKATTSPPLLLPARRSEASSPDAATVAAAAATAAAAGRVAGTMRERRAAVRVLESPGALRPQGVTMTMT